MDLGLRSVNSNILAFVVGAGMFLSSCSNDDSGNGKVDFDRKVMLENWADNIFIPAYTDFTQKSNDFNSIVNSFNSQPDSTNLNLLQNSFRELYISFQRIKAYEIGPALDISFRASVNTYPTDTSKILNNISSMSYNLSSAANLTARGLPALDYLLFGKSDKLRNEASYRSYLIDLARDINTLAQQVLNGWNGTYHSTFINASGTDIGSSLGQTVNSVVFDYELIKNAKVGFPAGKKSLGTPFPHACEAFFGGFSNKLIEENLIATHNFFKGLHFDGSQEGLGIEDYLYELEAKTQGQELDAAIDQQFISALASVRNIPEPLSISVVNYKTEVDQAYLEIQKNVVLLKNDMPSAMGVMITYQDNDGD